MDALLAEQAKAIKKRDGLDNFLQTVYKKVDAIRAKWQQANNDLETINEKIEHLKATERMGTPSECWKQLEDLFHGLHPDRKFDMEEEFCHLCQVKKPQVYLEGWTLDALQIQPNNGDDDFEQSVVPAMCQECFDQAYSMRFRFKTIRDSLVSLLNPHLAIPGLCVLVKQYVFGV